MLAAKDRETDRHIVGVPCEEAHDHGVDEQGVAAVDEEVELLQRDGRLY